MTRVFLILSLASVSLCSGQSVAKPVCEIAGTSAFAQETEPAALPASCTYGCIVARETGQTAVTCNALVKKGEIGKCSVQLDAGDVIVGATVSCDKAQTPSIEVPKQ